MREVVFWLIAGRTALTLVSGAVFALLWYGLIPQYWGARPRHAASRKRPSWTSTPLYLGLAVDRLQAEASDGFIALTASSARTGARAYVSLARLSRFARAVSSPHRTTKMVVRPVAPKEES